MTHADHGVGSLGVKVDTPSYTGHNATSPGSTTVTTASRFTTKDLEAMPEIEGVRYEIIDGELYVSTAPGRDHQHASVMLSTQLVNWTDESHLGEVLPTLGLVFPGDQNVMRSTRRSSTGSGSNGPRDCGAGRRRADGRDDAHRAGSAGAARRVSQPAHHPGLAMS
jgi:hypothetical protein